MNFTAQKNAVAELVAEAVESGGDSFDFDDIYSTSQEHFCTLPPLADVQRASYNLRTGYGCNCVRRVRSIFGSEAPVHDDGALMAEKV